ncbi:MAG: family 16 glycoside hydrolase [Planctomycetaceae bacterium]
MKSWPPSRVSCSPTKIDRRSRPGEWPCELDYNRGSPLSSSRYGFRHALPDHPLAGVKGDWKVQDGALVGRELPADKHAAVLNYQKKNRNSVVRFSFKFDGSTKGFNLSLNHDKGHLFRVVVAPMALSIQLDKDKKDAASKPLVLATAKSKFEAGQWYTIQVEMLGDRVVAQTDNGALVEASHPKLDVDKPNYRFVMKGDSLAIDDLQIAEVK